MRFTINLATKTYFDHRRMNRACVVLLVILLILLAWNINLFSWNLGTLNHLTAENANLEARLSGRPAGVPEKEYSKTMNSIRFYNGVIEHKSFNWLRLLDHLENATPAGVALDSLVPDLKEDLLKIEGRTKNFEMLKNYIEKLEDSKVFTNILLLSHNDLVMGEKTRGVRFTVSCRAVMQ